jgi:hypothetical protein
MITKRLVLIFTCLILAGFVLVPMLKLIASGGIVAWNLMVSKSIRDQPARGATIVNSVEISTSLLTVRLVDYYQKNIDLDSLGGGSIFTLAECRPKNSGRWMRAGFQLYGGRYRSQLQQIIAFSPKNVGVVDNHWYSVTIDGCKSWKTWYYPSDVIYRESFGFTPDGKGTIRVATSIEPGIRIYSTRDFGITWYEDR